MEDIVPVNKLSVTEKMRENPWILSTVVFGIVVLLLIFGGFRGGMTGNVISSNDAGEKLLDYYEQGGATGLELDSVTEVNGLYQVNFKYQGAIVPIYMTKDGSMAGSMTALLIKDSEEDIPKDIPKSDKPIVELFIMTHCPYGTQAEKGIIPTIKALGTSVNAKIRFVHYFMHGDEEESETYNQLCIREEQSSKYYDYLTCFLEDGDSARCLAKTGIDKVKLAECVTDKSEDYYAEDSDLSEEYGVQGSPTLVVNGVIVSSGRDSASYLSTICSAFDTEPSECSKELSSSTPSPGFGTGTTSSASTASCN